MSEEMQQELSAMKFEVAEFRESVAQEFSVVKGDIAQLKKSNHVIATAVVDLQGKVARIEGRLAQTATKDDIGRIIGIVAVRQERRIDGHDKRLSRLERKR